MKKGFLIYCTVVAVVLCWAAFFKFMHWPGAALMRLLETLLCLVAVIWGACIQNFLGKSVTIYNAIALSLTIVGLWFNAAHWPGATIILAVCFSILLPVGIIWSVANYIKRNSK